MFAQRYHRIVRFYNNNPSIEFILLALITLLASLFRFYHLGTWSFWWDELNTVRDAVIFWDYDLLGRTPFRLLNYLMLSNFEINEWNARIMPAVIGIITIPILYFPIRKIYGKDIALLSLFLLAISPWHIYWSQSARFYTILLLFYTLALLIFYMAIEEDNPVYLIISMVLMGMAIVERFTSGLIVIVIGLYLIFLLSPYFGRPKGLNIKNLLLLLIPGLISVVLIAPSFFTSITGFNANWINNNPFWVLAGVVYYIGLPVICIGSVGAAYQVIKKKRVGLLLSLNAILPIVVITIISTFMYTANRYMFITLTSWLILGAVAVKELLENVSGYGKLFSLGVVAILILSPLSEDMLYFRYQNGNRDDWKSALNFVKQNKQPGDLVVSANPAIGDYYLGETTISMAKIDLDSLVNSNKRIWFVEDFNVDEKWPRVHRWIRENATLVGVFDVHLQARVFTLRVYLYESAKQ